MIASMTKIGHPAIQDRIVAKLRHQVALWSNTIQKRAFRTEPLNRVGATCSQNPRPVDLTIMEVLASHPAYTRAYQDGFKESLRNRLGVVH